MTAGTLDCSLAAAQSVRRYAIREIRLTRIALWSALRDKEPHGRLLATRIGDPSSGCGQLTECTRKRRSPRGVCTTATSPARRPRSAAATGESIDRRPSPGARPAPAARPGRVDRQPAPARRRLARGHERVADAAAGLLVLDLDRRA